MVKFCRYLSTEDKVEYGLQHKNGSITVANSTPWAGLQDTGKPASIKTYMSPVDPTMVICIGLNYAKHAAELGLAPPKNPVVFMKPPSSAVGHKAKVVKPRSTVKFDYEVELAIVIGKPCKDVSVEEAMDYVLGFTVANDLSTRDWQKAPALAGGQWCRSKGFDGFSPLGPVLVTTDEIPDPNNLKVAAYVNGKQRQNSSTQDLIFNVQEIVSFLSNGCTLTPGTVIMSGTPEGVAEGKDGNAKPGMDWLQAGDNVVVEIEHIGKLEIDIVPDTATTKCYVNHLLPGAKSRL